MSPADSVRYVWRKWQVTLAYLLIAMSFLFAYVLVAREAGHRVDSACDSVTQVKHAAFSLSKPASTAGVTDPATLARIKAANDARAQARHQLADALACKN